jgi:translation initiation factor 2B subunit (eIF-2B alpha/beta/delta family)
VSKDVSDHAASFVSEAYLRPRKPGGEKPTISQIPVMGVPVVFSTKKVELTSSNDATNRGQALNVNPEPLDKRKTDLYNIKVDLAPEGYISVYITNSTASTFCESEVQ